MANSLKESYIRGKKAMKEGGNGADEKTEKGADKEKDLRRIIIEESDNGGFIVTCEYEMKPLKGSNPMMTTEDTKKVFVDWDNASAFLDDLFGD